jgi:hypothetical protein
MDTVTGLHSPINWDIAEVTLKRTVTACKAVASGSINWKLREHQRADAY